MEARIARLESDVNHIRGDLSDVKSDVRALRDRIDGVDQRLGAKIDSVDTRLGGKIDDLKDELHSAKIWALLLYVALAAGMYATMARAFGWL